MRRLGRRGSGVGSGAGNGASGWTPVNLGANLVAWYKAVADDMSLSGSNVTAWAAHLGYGPNLSNVVGTPDWNSSDSNFGGHGSVSFAKASTECLYSSTWGGVPSGNDVPFACAAAYKMDAIDGTVQTAWCVVDSASVGHRFFVYNNISSEMRTEKQGGSVPRRLLSSALNNNNAHYVVFNDSGTYAYLRSDGAADKDGTSDTLTMNTLDQIVLAASESGTPSFPGNVTIAELILIDKELSDYEISELELYLALEHGL